MTKFSPENRLSEVAERKNVSLRPAHLFMKKQVISITVGTRIYSAVKILQTHGISGAPVVDNSGTLIGVVSDYDLLLQAATRDVSEPIIYNKKVQFVEEETPVQDIIVILYKTKYRRLPVVDRFKKVVGIVSRVDVLMELLDLP